MINFYVTYTLKDRAAREGFYEEIKACGVIEKSLAEEGCLRYAYYYPADRENQIFLWEQWESRQAQQRHQEQPHFRALGDIKTKYRAETELLIEEC